MPSTVTDIIDGISTSTAVKAPVRTASTTHLTLFGEQTVSGVAVVDGDRVLVNAQNDSVFNGIYDVHNGEAWTRSKDFNGPRDARVGTTVFVVSATKFYRLTGADPIIIDEDPINWFVTIITSDPTTITTVDSFAELRMTISLVDGAMIGLTGYYEAGDAPFRTFKWDASSTQADDGGGWAQVTGVATGRWVCTQLDPVFGSWYGVTYDNVTDDYDAWMRALHRPLRIDTVFFNGPHSGTTIFEERGISYCSQTIEWSAYGTWRGGGAHIVNAHSCVIRNPANVGGFQFNSHNTTGNTTKANGGSAAGSTVEGISFRGGYHPGAVGTIGRGIRARAQCILNNVHVQGYAEEGIFIQAAVGGGGAFEGNCNLSSVTNARIQNCGGHGMFVDSADANACLFSRIDATFNGGFGIYESSFLGNTWVQCHSDFNGLGGYKSDSAVASVFISPYAEGGQPDNEFSDTALIVGGIVGTTGDGISLYPFGGQLWCSGGYQSRGYDASDNLMAAQLGGEPTNGTILHATHATMGPNAWRLAFDAGSGGDLGFSYSNAFFPFVVTGPNTPKTFGRSAPEPYAFVALKFFTGISGRQLEHYPGIPASGNAGQGDWVFDTGAAPSGIPARVCTTAGVKGSTAVYKNVAVLSA